MSNPEFERAVLRRLVHDKRLTKAKAAEILGASIGAQRKRPWARQGPLRRLRSNLSAGEAGRVPRPCGLQGDAAGVIHIRFGGNLTRMTFAGPIGERTIRWHWVRRRLECGR